MQRRRLKTEGESMSAHNDLRADQILYNHGPGSVLETKRGPAVVNSFAGASVPPTYDFPQDFRLVEPRLESLLGETARLYRLPTNEDVGDRGRAIVSTRTFPRWLLCSEGHRQKTILHPGPGPGKPGCSECGGYGGRPVRFVQFCSKGHLEEIDWWSAVHPKGSKCASQTFEWSGGGGALRNLTISCTMCSASTTMDQISSRPCRGGHLHLGQDTNDCDERARVTLRGSTQIWQGLHRRVISIPQDDLLKLVATVMEDDLVARRTLAQVAAMGEAMAAAGLVTAEGPSEWEHYIEAINFKLNPRKPLFTADANRLINTVIRSGPGGVGDFESTYDRLLDDGTNFVVDVFDDEFRGLVNSLRPTVHPSPPAAPWFIIEGAGGHGPFQVGPTGPHVVIEPITTLRSVLALEGFVRGAVQDGPTPVDVGFPLGDERWLPATESFGEGLLLQLSDDSTLRDGGVRWNEWAQAHTNEVARCIAGGEPKRFIHRAESDIDPKAPERTARALAEFRPEFVWWHTFAHALIRSIQADTGYSSSAIRERVYLTKRNDAWVGGILLYVTEGGMSGTLGGLTSLLPDMQAHIDRAVRASSVCSNDPLCEEDVRINGPPDIACYACSMNPETSCEHRNLFLDRLLFMELS